MELQPTGEIVGYKYHYVYKARYPLYDQTQTTPLPPKRTFLAVEMTDEHLYEALYLINKSAKKSRDTKKAKYEEGRYSSVSRAKKRQNRLYDLKDQVMRKMIREGKLTPMGYHTQTVMITERVPINEPDEDEPWEVEYRVEKKEATHYLVLYQEGTYTFHAPATEKLIQGIKHLGDIGIIPAEKSRETKIGFHQAVELLNRYMQ